MQSAGLGRAMGRSDEVAVFLSFQRGGIYADSFIIIPLNNAWNANDSPKSWEGARMYFHNFFLERRCEEGNERKSHFSLRSQDRNHSFEDFVSSWQTSGGAFFFVCDISATAFWGLSLLLCVLPSLTVAEVLILENKSWDSLCSHTNTGTSEGGNQRCGLLREKGEAMGDQERPWSEGAF